MRTRKKGQALKRMTSKAASVCVKLIFYRLGAVRANPNRFIPVKGSRVGAVLQLGWKHGKYIPVPNGTGIFLFRRKI